MALLQQDVPGAILKNVIIENNSVKDLKRWLQCRGLPTNVNKPALVERVRNCIKSKKEDRIIVSIDGGVWFAKKYSKKSDSEITKLPTSGWRKFPSNVIPKSFSFATINEYVANIISDNTDSDSDEMEEFVPSVNNTKSMRRARISFVSGHVQNMEDHSYSSHYFLRAQVRASFRNELYPVHIVLSQIDSSILGGGCKCKASEAKSCSHIVALLFALEDYTIRFGYQPVTCTSLPKEWNKGRKNGNDPLSVFDASYSENGIVESNRRRFLNFNPERKNCESNDLGNSQYEFLNALQTINAEEPCMFEYLLKIEYSDYALDSAERAVLLEKVLIMEQNLSSGCHSPMEIVKNQNNDEWLSERRVRITASQAKSFFTAKDYNNLIRQKLWDDIDLSYLPAFIYGRVNESIAFDTYHECFAVCEDLRKAGLFINDKYPGLAVSPDGIFFLNSKMVGLLEIKCPISMKNLFPYEIEGKTNIFYNVDENRNMTLIRNHDYFFQVQLSLAILELSYCIFVVWTPKGILFEKIYRDEVLISSLTSKLALVHRNILIPEYFEMRLPRNLELLQLI